MNQRFELGDNIRVVLTGEPGEVSATLYDFLPDGSDLIRAQFLDDEGWFEPKYLKREEAMPDSEPLAA